MASRTTCQQATNMIFGSVHQSRLMFLERKSLSMYSIIGLEASMYLLISFCTEQSVSFSLTINCSLLGRVYIPAPTAFLIAQL
uniref:Uncharacterized protein n=1 Tax=Arundo donax TaxID=35708 RepID=A0A0A8XNH9_ARUDO